MRFRLVLPLLLTALLVFPGCDDGGGSNSFTFDIDGVRFTFEFQGNEVIGQSATISSDGMESLVDAIRDQNFEPGDVISIRPSGEGQIKILAPIGADVDVLDSVTLRVVGGGSSATVGSQDDFGSMTGTMSSEADLDLTNSDISGIAAAGSFSAELDVEGSASAVAGTTYRVEARFDVTVEVEGI